MADRTFTLDEIRAAFWANFKGAGELWFPSREEEAAENATATRWEEFADRLTNGNPLAAFVVRP